MNKKQLFSNILRMNEDISGAFIPKSIQNTNVNYIQQGQQIPIKTTNKKEQIEYIGDLIAVPCEIKPKKTYKIELYKQGNKLILNNVEFLIYQTFNEKDDDYETGNTKTFSFNKEKKNFFCNEDSLEKWIDCHSASPDNTIIAYSYKMTMHGKVVFEYKVNKISDEEYDNECIINNNKSIKDGIEGNYQYYFINMLVKHFMEKDSKNCY